MSTNTLYFLGAFAFLLDQIAWSIRNFVDAWVPITFAIGELVIIVVGVLLQGRNSSKLGAVTTTTSSIFRLKLDNRSKIRGFYTFMLAQIFALTIGLVIFLVSFFGSRSSGGSFAGMIIGFIALGLRFILLLIAQVYFFGIKLETLLCKIIHYVFCFTTLVGTMVNGFGIIINSPYFAITSGVCAGIMFVSICINAGFAYKKNTMGFINLDNNIDGNAAAFKSAENDII